MSHHRPLGHDLRDAFAHEELAAGIARIERRLAHRRALRRAGLATIALAAIAASTVTAWPARHAHVEPLTRADGGSLTTWTDEAVRLSDGSTVRVAPAGELSVTAQSEGAVTFHLARGTARFDVRPGGPRRWSIEAGPLRVYVLGTSFTVTHEGGFASVAVHRGVVAIATDNETRRLYAGERFEIGSRLAPVASTEATPDDEGRSTTPAEASQPPPLPPTPTSSGGSSAEHAAEATAPSRGPTPAPRGATAPVGMERAPPSPPEPAPPAPAPLSALLDEADRARREGRVEDAVDALWAIVEAHPGASEASSAAVTAARLEQQQGRLEAAIDAYRRALALRPSPAVAELCYEALVSCHLARSDRGAAERTAAEHRRAFPSGTRADAIDALLRRR